MADKFYDGMPNVNEALNEMDRNFGAGPFGSLPISGGTLTGPVGSTSTISAPTLEAGRLYVGYNSGAAQSVIARDAAAEGEPVLSLRYVADFNRTSLGFGSSVATAINVTSNSVTGRSINTPGSINANGADYAEYLIKGLLCGTIAPGQIVGIDVDGHLTDKWDLAISFVVKSTNPCMVGGDSWAVHLGERPEDPSQWPHFDAELENARQRVDRIAFAGQVPVNLQGATPGQFIVPVQAGDAIGGMAIDEADITLNQYMRAIGRVIAIEDDGRARIIVKVA